VVRVDVQVALGLHREVEPAVPPELADHVVEERHAGVAVRLAGPVEVQLDADVALLGGALHQRRACHAAKAIGTLVISHLRYAFRRE